MKLERRSFISKTVAGTAAAGALAFPMVAKAQQTFNWKMTSAYGKGSPFYMDGPGSATDLAKRIREMSGGRLNIQVFGAGELIPAFEGFDAVRAGTVEMNHANSYFWTGKTFAAQYFTAVPFGLNFQGMNGWLYDGGGIELWNEVYAPFGMVAMPCGNTGVQMTGWFKKEINSVNDLKGLKMRIPGLAGKVYANLGVDVKVLPGGEIFPALERGVIDAAEFNNPSSDRVLGFPDVAKNYYVQSYHQAVECFEILFNKTKFDALPDEHKALLRHSAEAASADMSWKLQDRYSADLLAMAQQQQVNVRPTPTPILDAQLAAWNRVIERMEGDNSNPNNGPLFKEICDSQRAWCRRVGNFFLRYQVSPVRSFNHFFARG